MGLFGLEILMTEIPNWHITGDWFDNCSCGVACPCTFAQAPDNGFCESVLFWHVRSGHYGDINLDDLSFVRVGRWEGDLWAGKAKGVAGMFIDERANERQAEVLPSLLAAVPEDFRDSLLRCSPKVGSPAVWSGHESPSRSRPTALNGE
jgi:Protein of unknown function (DUF1326)